MKFVQWLLLRVTTQSVRQWNNLGFNCCDKTSCMFLTNEHSYPTQSVSCMGANLHMIHKAWVHMPNSWGGQIPSWIPCDTREQESLVIAPGWWRCSKCYLSEAFLLGCADSLSLIARCDLIQRGGRHKECMHIALLCVSCCMLYTLYAVYPVWVGHKWTLNLVRYINSRSCSAHLLLYVLQTTFTTALATCYTAWSCLLQTTNVFTSPVATALPQFVITALVSGKFLTAIC